MPELDPEQVRLAARLADVLGTRDRAGDARRRGARGPLAGLRALYDAAACSFAQVQPDGESLRFVAADGAGAADIIGVVLPVAAASPAGSPCLATQITDLRRHDPTPGSLATSPKPPSTCPPPSSPHQSSTSRGGTVGVLEVLDFWQSGGGVDKLAYDLRVLEPLAASWLAAIVRLADLYERLGTGLIRDPGRRPRRLRAPTGSRYARRDYRRRPSPSTNSPKAFRTLAARPGHSGRTGRRRGSSRDVADLSGRS